MSKYLLSSLLGRDLRIGKGPHLPETSQHTTTFDETGYSRPKNRAVRGIRSFGASVLVIQPNELKFASANNCSVFSTNKGVECSLRYNV